MKIRGERPIIRCVPVSLDQALSEMGDTQSDSIELLHGDTELPSLKRSVRPDPEQRLVTRTRAAAAERLAHALLGTMAATLTSRIGKGKREDGWGRGSQVSTSGWTGGR
jgi:hypothetical protein